MSARRALLASLALLLAAGALCVLLSLRTRHPTPASQLPAIFTPLPPPSAPSGLASPPPVFQATPPPEPAQGSPLAAELNAATGSPQRDLEVLHTLLTQYFRRLHQRPGPPIGDDIDLAHALTGHNPGHIVLLPPDHPALSADGHLRDRWGTPYFIHHVSGNVFELRSAGPDRKLFTIDDVTWAPTHGPEE